MLNRLILVRVILMICGCYTSCSVLIKQCDYPRAQEEKPHFPFPERQKSNFLGLNGGNRKISDQGSWAITCHCLPMPMLHAQIRLSMIYEIHTVKNTDAVNIEQVKLVRLLQRLHCPELKVLDSRNRRNCAGQSICWQLYHLDNWKHSKP